MQPVEYTPAMIFAALMALILEWFPVISEKWDGLSAAKKTALNAFGVALISVASMGVSCWRGGECPADPWDAVIQFLLTALLSLAANQATYNATKREHFE